MSTRRFQLASRSCSRSRSAFETATKVMARSMTCSALLMDISICSLYVLILSAISQAYGCERSALLGFPNMGPAYFDCSAECPRLATPVNGVDGQLEHFQEKCEAVFRLECVKKQ